MAYGIPERETIIENLTDAGCSETFIKKFLQVLTYGSIEEQQQLLACERCRLVKCVHVEQRKLDCLDYLRYSIKKQTAVKGKKGEPV